MRYYHLNIKSSALSPHRIHNQIGYNGKEIKVKLKTKGEKMSRYKRARRREVLFSWVGRFGQNFLNFTAVHNADFGDNEFLKLHMRVFEKAFIIKLISVLVKLKQKSGYKCFKPLSATGKSKKTGLTLKDREGALMSIKSPLSITEMYKRGIFWSCWQNRACDCSASLSKDQWSSQKVNL